MDLIAFFILIAVFIIMIFGGPIVIEVQKEKTKQIELQWKRDSVNSLKHVLIN